MNGFIAGKENNSGKRFKLDKRNISGSRLITGIEFEVDYRYVSG